ncbi:hypothetical protein Pfo_024631, partial [Paulownia fortunei]
MVIILCISLERRWNNFRKSSLTPRLWTLKVAGAVGHGIENLVVSFVCVYICIYVDVYVCVCIYIYIYIYIYILRERKRWVVVGFNGCGVFGHQSYYAWERR